MMKKMIAATVTLLLSSSFCLAQTAAATDKVHRTKDQRARICKKEAADQNLGGEEARNYVIKCMKG